MSLAILAGQLMVANTQSSALGKIGSFGAMYTGYNFATNSWQLPQLAVGYGPWIAKRFLLPIARVRIPLRGLPVSIS